MYLGSELQQRPYWVIDIETDDLDATVIWVLCAKNVKTKEGKTLTNLTEIRNFIDEEQNKNAVFVGHNALSFDIPVINRLAGTRVPVSRVLDTYILSMVFNPSLSGGHSLDAWGQRLKSNKIDFDDWSHLSPQMIEYCKQDVDLTRQLFLSLSKKMNTIGISERGLKIEHEAWHVINLQKKNGFAFDINKAQALYTNLRGIESEIKREIDEYWPPKLCPIKTYKRPFKADGSSSKVYEGHCERFPKLVLSKDRQSYTCYDYVEFDVGSPKQRIEKLVEAGWKARERTKPSKTHPDGQPQPTVKGKLSPSLQQFIEENDLPQVNLITEWMAINSRANMVNTWMQAYNHETGAIHGSLFLANTLRYRHSSPNTANIPAVRFDDDGKPKMGRLGEFTYEARDLWTCSDTIHRTLVGVDASGIQLRVLAHYLNNPEFTKQLLEGDPHEYNRKLAGIDTRPKAKTFIYAFLLGAGDAKVGEIVGGSTKDGKAVKIRFKNNFPGLRELLDRLENEQRRTGRITLCDGLKIPCEHPHTVLGYLLQGDESRIMKVAKVLVHKKCSKEKLDIRWQGDIHDEWQVDVPTKHVDRFIEICEECFRKAGESFNYRIQIDCEAKKGKTWAETH